ncbi:hypothetical protein MEQU1_001513 [Malassezia equina]|uniref:SCP2 domain-containing protein n=1 Tax=Malassezia equina TaxID=1381935 RepID=A0AAF0IYF7_9BASI|nr:hypothetical protein MEQU1_001513 [Malassezia equina]
MPSHVYEPIANHALAVYPRLNAPGFESSKVFALTALYLASPPPGFPSQRALGKHLASLYLFILHPTKRRKSEYVPEAPEVFFIHVTKDKTEVGRGTASKFSKRLLQGRTRNVVVMECTDRDLVNIATGKSLVDPMIADKKISIRGDIQKLEQISQILHHERSKLYRSVVTEPEKEKDEAHLDEEPLQYSVGGVPRARL